MFWTSRSLLILLYFINGKVSRTESGDDVHAGMRKWQYQMGWDMDVLVLPNDTCSHASVLYALCALVAATASGWNVPVDMHNSVHVHDII